MKNIFYTLCLMAVSAMTFVACEDVPEPYDTPSGGKAINEDTTKVVPAVPTGDGTLENPFNAAMALKVIQDGTFDADKDYYVKGRVAQIDELSTSFGNATYWLSDDGTTTTMFEIYRGYGMNGDKFASENDLVVGDSVIACGKLVNYNGSTPEMTRGSKIVYRNGIGTTPAAEKGTQGNPYSIAEALALVSAGTAPTTEVCVKGIITEVTYYNSTYNSLSYNISDDGTKNNVLQIYSGKGLNGAAFSSKNDLKAGQTVVVKGILKEFKGAAEIDKNNVILSITGDGTGTDKPSGSVVPANTEATAFGVDRALEIINNKQYGADTKYYVIGRISRINTKSDVATFGDITYWISDDGSDSNELEIFQGLYLNGEKFTSLDQIKEGQTVVVLGTLTSYNGTSEMGKKNILISIK